MAYVTAESRKVETIEAFHSLCQSELTNAKECIETYKIKANEMYNLAKSSICGAQINAEDIDVYDTALTNMFQIIDVLERFNDKSKSILPQSFGSQVKEERKREKFTYIKPDLSKYAENSTINCVVAYIDPKDKLEFYINIPGNTDFEQFLDRYSNFLTEKIEELTTIPEEGDVFGLNLENCFFRAVRQNDLIEEEPVYPFKAYLIDTGESTLITKDTIKYVIEPQYRKIPAQAIPCILLSVNSNNNINERKIYMADQLYKTQNITVLARDSRTLYVNINAIETANANGAKQIKTGSSVKQQISPEPPTPNSLSLFEQPLEFSTRLQILKQMSRNYERAERLPMCQSPAYVDTTAPSKTISMVDTEPSVKQQTSPESLIQNSGCDISKWFGQPMDFRESLPLFKQMTPDEEHSEERDRMCQSPADLDPTVPSRNISMPITNPFRQGFNGGMKDELEIAEQPTADIYRPPRFPNTNAVPFFSATRGNFVIPGNALYYQENKQDGTNSNEVCEDKEIRNSELCGNSDQSNNTLPNFGANLYRQYQYNMANDNLHQILAAMNLSPDQVPENNGENIPAEVPKPKSNYKFQLHPKPQVYKKEMTHKAFSEE